MSLLPFLWLLSFITFVISAVINRNEIKTSDPAQECQSGRVCMNSCYSNKQLSNCNKLNTIKSILFDPSYNHILPSIHLKVVQIDSYDFLFTEDVIIKIENLTSHGMNIRFNLLTQSIRTIICADWYTCSLESNL